MKRSLLVTVSVIVISALTAAQAVAAPKIQKASHTHPEGKDFSYVCVKVKGDPGDEVEVFVTGPSFPAPQGKAKNIKIPQSGQKKVTFKITSTGTYNFTLYGAGSGAEGFDSESHTVPPPPPDGPKHGPFKCKG